MDHARENITDILCIGSQKASTSWLHSVLNRHPDTYAFPDLDPITSTCKEAHFWDRNHDRGEEWYRSLMMPPEPAMKTMDFTPEYAFLPEHLIAECKRLNPTAKVIYILRDPLARAVSAFRMHMLWRFGADLGKRLDLVRMLPEFLPHVQLDRHGLYVRNAEAWRRHYPDILLLNYEDLHADRAASMSRIMAHVGLDPARLTGESRQRFDAEMAGKVWESQRFPVDRDVLLFLEGHISRTRAAVRNTYGIEFTEGQKMIDDATTPEALTVLTQIHDEMVRNREVTEAQQATLQSLRDEVRGEKHLIRLTLNQSVKEMEQDIAETLERVQISMAQTLGRIHDERLSLARFGDGELMQVTISDYNIGFQRNTPELQQDLIKALDPDWLAPGRVMVTLPPPFTGNLHWLGVWIKIWAKTRALIHDDKIYGDTLISRPKFFQSEGDAGIAQWRRLWSGRPVLVVTGQGSRFDLLPALFDSVAKVDFLHTVPVHAYSEIDSILGRILDSVAPDTLVLLSLGPTATILAHRLAAAGVQALDLGHISASYNFVYANGALPERLPMANAPK